MSAASQDMQSVITTVVRWNAIVAAVLIGLFCLLFVPFALLNDAKNSRLPVVEAVASGHHVLETKVKGGVRRTVVVTLEFERPDGHRCRVNRFGLGEPGQPRSYDERLQVAIHPSSCGEIIRLPYEPNWNERVGAFVFMLIIGVVGTTLITLGQIEITAREAAAQSPHQARTLASSGLLSAIFMLLIMACILLLSKTLL